MQRKDGRRRPLRWLVGASLLVFATAACVETQAEPRKARSMAGSSDSEVVAEIQGATITREELNRKALGATLKQRQEIYQTERQILEQMIEEKLLEREAEKRGMSVDDLVAKEIEGKIDPVTDAEIQSWYEANKARVRNAPLNDNLKGQIRNYLQSQRASQAREAYLGPLKEKAGMAILLDAPRVEVEVGNDPALGPAKAAVTIVEFSDFQ